VNRTLEQKIAKGNRSKLEKRKGSKEDSSIANLAFFVLGSSRTVYDETTKYAAFRMLQIFQRIVNLESVRSAEHGDYRSLREISDAITKNDEVLMRGSPKEFVEFLDSLVSRAAEELKKRR